jgi:putative nucleotidyltransferase-like protein
MSAASSGAPSPNAEATAWNLLLESVAGEVVEQLRRAGYRSLLIKGVTIGRWLYPGEARQYSDVDVLVEPGSFEECERVLAGLGFARSALERAFGAGGPSHASTWIRGSVPVDLHRTVVGLGVSPAEAWSALSEVTETCVVGSQEVEVPAIPARALLIAIHLAQHGPNFARTRDDLRRALELVPHAEWAEAAHLARRLAAEASMASGLAGVEGGPELCERLGLQTGGAVRLEGSPAFHIAQGLAWFSGVEGTRARFGYAARKLFPPPSLMRARFEWSRPGPVALGAAYLLRLVRLAVHTPRAAWVLLRLRSSRGDKPIER